MRVLLPPDGYNRGGSSLNKRGQSLVGHPASSIVSEHQFMPTTISLMSARRYLEHRSRRNAKSFSQRSDIESARMVTLRSRIGQETFVHGSPARSTANERHPRCSKEWS